MAKKKKTKVVLTAEEVNSLITELWLLMDWDKWDNDKAHREKIKSEQPILYSATKKIAQLTPEEELA